jgi:hypothetical protein
MLSERREGLVEHAQSASQGVQAFPLFADRRQLGAPRSQYQINLLCNTQLISPQQ